MAANPQLSEEVLPAWADSRLQFLLDYWNGKRGARRFPARSDIDPLDFAPHWPLVYLVEGGSLPELTLRLAGTAYRDLYGFEITGHKLTDLIPRTQRRDVVADYENCLITSQPIFRADTMTWRPQNAKISYHRLLLPLGGEGGGITHILAIAVFFDMNGQIMFV
jgi:hypothetical protein